MQGAVGYLVQCALLIAVASAVRVLFRRKVPHWAFRLMWIGIAVRMLIPIPVSVPSGVPNPVSGLVASFSAVYAFAGGESSPSASALQNEMSSAVSVPESLVVVWIVGSVVCAVVCVLAYGTARRRIVPLGEIDDPTVFLWIEEIHLHRHVRVVWSRIGTPATRGIVSPVVLLPPWFSLLDKEAKLAVLKHELVHIRRFDAVVKALLLCAACAQWFNPFAWVFVSLGFRDIELACDEAVLKGASSRDRSAYARLLLDAVDFRWRFLPALSSGGYTSLKRRVFAVMRPAGFHFSALCTMLAILLASTAFSAVSPQQLIVKTADYELAIPGYWLGRVSVSSDGLETRVFPNGHPDCPLVIAKTVDNETPLTASSPGLILLDSGETKSGDRVELWGVDYLSMVAGDTWRTSEFATPDYPGESAERELIDLATGGDCDIQLLKESNSSSDTLLELYKTLVIPSFSEK